MYKARIIIGDNDGNHRRRLKDFLNKAGYVVMYEDSDGLKLLKAIQQMSPDLVILDGKLDIQSGFDIAQTMAETDLVPVILMSSYAEPDSTRRAAECLAFAHLIKPVEEANLYAAIEIALANYQRVLELKKEIKKHQMELQSRKLVEKAKGLLMKHQGLSEMEAYNRLRRESMNRHTSMGKIADSIIAFYQMMGEK